jgi:transposase
MISPAALEQQLARAVAKIRECAGDNPDVVWLIEGIERHPDAVCKVVARKNRGGKSAHQAASLAQRDGALRRLRASLCPTLQSFAAAAFIATKFQRYESDRWPRERDEVVAPLDEPERTFWAILRGRDGGGPKMPGVSGRSSQRWRLRQLAMILERPD